MANALVGKASVCITCLAPNDTAAEALRDFFVGHREFMEEKSYQNGPLSMVHYSISESPEYERDDAAWAQGKYPETTGKTIFICTRFMNQQMDCIIIGLNPQSFFQFLGNYSQPIK